MILALFLFLQFAAAIAGGALLWRRLERQKRQIGDLRHALEALQAAGGARRQRRSGEKSATVVQIVERAPALTAVPSSPPRDEAAALSLAPTWRLPLTEDLFPQLPETSAATARGAALGLAATLPAVVFFFTANHALAIALGLCVAAGMMLVALTAPWRVAAWAAVCAGGAWAAIGLALQVAQAQPLAYCVALALAGGAGLAYSYLREAAAGATLALIMSAAALALGSQIGMIGAAGVAFAAIVAGAALIGALWLKLESIHLAAFGATLIGLFVLSGQESAAIWFTPVTAWAGALFFAIAAVRAPRLGARGITLAGTGALAPLLAIAALYGSHQGLADPRAAGAAFGVLALLLGLIIAATAQRHQRGVAALKLTLWALAAGGFMAAVAAALLALPSPFTASPLAAIALGLALVDRRFPDAVWRVCGSIAAILAAFEASTSISLVLREAPAWDPLLVVVGGLALPAALTGGAALLAHRNNSAFTAGLCKLVSIGVSVITTDVVLRLVFSGGAPLMQPTGFVEAGFHIAAWLAVALFVAARAEKKDASAVRNAAALVLGAGALAMSAVIAALWLTPHWETLIPSRVAWAALRFEGLGFIAPAALFWAHWVFWRARGSNVRTRVSLGAGAALTACFITLEAMHPQGGGSSPGALSALVGALSFALAIVINFAPGIVASAPRASHFQENLHRHGRDEQPRQAR